MTSSQSNLCDAQDDFPPAATAQNLGKLAKLIVPTGPQIIQMAGEGAKAPPHRKSNFSQASLVALAANLSAPVRWSFGSADNAHLGQSVGVEGSLNLVPWTLRQIARLRSEGSN